jgi:hypothetical protein
LTNDVRQIFHEVYEKMGDDGEIIDTKTGKKRKMTGIEAMLEWARGAPTEFYRLYGKMIPTTQELAIDNHEDFLDELVIEAEATITPALEAEATTSPQITTTKEVSPHDVSPDEPDIDANLV